MIIPDCVEPIAEYYHVPSNLVRSIIQVEGGRKGSRIGPNRNGTFDLGVMQINTVWLPELEQYNIDESSLVWDECTNIAVGTWILSGRYYEFGEDWTKAIQSYNAGYILSNGYNYAYKVLTVWNELHKKDFENENFSKK